jgi:hypothetical protein
VVLIGGHADVGVLTGGGSAQVDASGGSVVPPPTAQPGATPMANFMRGQVWLPSSPLRAMTARLPSSKATYGSGDDLAAAASVAKAADIAIVFGYQADSEGMDPKSLDLSEEQHHERDWRAGKRIARHHRQAPRTRTRILRAKLEELREFAVSPLSKMGELLARPENVQEAHEALAERRRPTEQRTKTEKRRISLVPKSISLVKKSCHIPMVAGARPVHSRPRTQFQVEVAAQARNKYLISFW